MKIGYHEHDFKFDLPDYPLKRDFTPGTFSENDWQVGETACTVAGLGTTAVDGAQDGSGYHFGRRQEAARIGIVQ